MTTTLNQFTSGGEKRQRERLAESMTLQLAGRLFRTHDFSDRGFRLPAGLSARDSGKIYPVTIKLRVNGNSLLMRFAVRPVWSDAVSSGFEFFQPDARQTKLLSQIYQTLQARAIPTLQNPVIPAETRRKEPLLASREEPAAGTLPLLASATPAPQPTESATASAAPVKQGSDSGILMRALRPLFWGLAALLIGLSLTLLVLPRFTALHIDTAILESPLHTLTSPGNGNVIGLAAEPGAVLAQGQLILQISNNDEQIEVLRAELEVAMAELELVKITGLQEAGDAGLSQLANISAGQLQAAQFLVSNASTRLTLTRDKLNRSPAREGGGSTVERNTSLNEYQRAEVEYELAQAKLKTLQHLRTRAVEDAAPKPSATTRDAAVRRVAATRAKLDTLRRQSSFDLLAPFAARLNKISTQRGANVVPGEELAVLENLVAPRARAYLTTNEAAKINKRQGAQITLPASTEKLNAVVLSVSPPGDSKQQKLPYSPDRSVEVLLQLTEPLPPGSFSFTRGDLDVIVRFIR